MIDKNASFLDVLTMGNAHDVAVVLPTLPHAIHWWPRVTHMFKDYHGFDYLHVSKTGIVSFRSRTIIRLWVPYAPDPTMPMDFNIGFKLHCDYAYLYGMDRP